MYLTLTQSAGAIRYGGLLLARNSTKMCCMIACKSERVRGTACLAVNVLHLLCGRERQILLHWLTHLIAPMVCHQQHMSTDRSSSFVRIPRGHISTSMYTAPSVRCARSAHHNPRVTLDTISILPGSASRARRPCHISANLGMPDSPPAPVLRRLVLSNIPSAPAQTYRTSLPPYSHAFAQPRLFHPRETTSFSFSGVSSISNGFSIRRRCGGFYVAASTPQCSQYPHVPSSMPQTQLRTKRAASDSATCLYRYGDPYVCPYIPCVMQKADLPTSPPQCIVYIPWAGRKSTTNLTSRCTTSHA